MTIAGSLVLFAVLWFLCLFVILPQRLKTQGDVGDVAPGTPASAPSEAMMGKKLRWATIMALVVWGLIIAIVTSGVVSLDDLDIFNSPI